MIKGLVSIIIPTFNRADLIGDTLDSVLSQTYDKWECIIVDDGSEDHTESIVLDFCQKDSRFRFYNRQADATKGANACRNYGFDISQGEFIKWFDSDDIMKPELIAIQFDHLTRNSDLDCSIVYGETFDRSLDHTNIQRPKNIDPKDPISAFILNEIHFSTLGPLWRREFLNDNTLFDESYSKLQDTEFHFRMVLNRMKFEFMDKSLFYIRVDNERISSKTSIGLLDSIFRYHFQIFEVLDDNDISDNAKDHVLNKLLSIFYRIFKHNTSIKTRYQVYSNYKDRLNRLLGDKEFGFFRRLKVRIGVINVILFRKGLRFFR